MDVHLAVAASEVVRLFVNGGLEAEITVGLSEDRDALLAQVRAARGLTQLARWIASLADVVASLETVVDHVNPKLEQRQAAFLRGLREGLSGVTVPYPQASAGQMPGLPPEHSASYRRGYAEGEGWRRALALGEAL
jgi:hypothetical protein